MERVRRRAAHRGGAERLHGGQALSGVLPATGIARAPRARAPSKPAQNPTKSPKENGKKTGRPGRGPRPRRTKPQQRAHHSQDSCGVEPAERRAGGARRLVHADVAIERVAEIAPEGRMRGLVRRPARLAREGQPPEVVQVRRSAGPVRPARFHRAVMNAWPAPGPRQRLDAGPLVPAKSFRIERLEPPVQEGRRKRRSCRTLDRGRNPVHTILVVDDERWCAAWSATCWSPTPTAVLDSRRPAGTRSVLARERPIHLLSLGRRDAVMKGPELATECSPEARRPRCCSCRRTRCRRWPRPDGPSSASRSACRALNDKGPPGPGAVLPVRASQHGRPSAPSSGVLS